jgi:hypothetical protein
MKAAFLVVALLMMTPAQAAQTVTRIGICEVVSVNVKKSVNVSRGVRELNVIADLEITRFTEAGHDYRDLSLVTNEGEYIPFTSRYAYGTPAGDSVQVVRNNTDKLELTFQNGHAKSVLKFDYRTNKGSLDYKQKIRDWSRTVSDEHYVHELRNCNLIAPLNLYP